MNIKRTCLGEGSAFERAPRGLLKVPRRVGLAGSASRAAPVDSLGSTPRRAEGWRVPLPQPVNPIDQPG